MMRVSHSGQLLMDQCLPAIILLLNWKPFKPRRMGEMVKSLIEKILQTGYRNANLFWVGRRDWHVQCAWGPLSLMDCYTLGWDQTSLDGTAMAMTIIIVFSAQSFCRSKLILETFQSFQRITPKIKRGTKEWLCWSVWNAMDSKNGNNRKIKS